MSLESGTNLENSRGGGGRETRFAGRGVSRQPELTTDSVFPARVLSYLVISKRKKRKKREHGSSRRYNEHRDSLVSKINTRQTMYVVAVSRQSRSILLKM